MPEVIAALVFPRSGYSRRTARVVLDHVHSEPGQPREPGLAAFTDQVDQVMVTKISQLAPYLVERQSDPDVRQHPPDDLFAHLMRTARVYHAQNAPACLFALPLFEINCVRHRVCPSAR